MICLVYTHTYVHLSHRLLYYRFYHKQLEATQFGTAFRDGNGRPSMQPGWRFQHVDELPLKEEEIRTRCTIILQDAFRSEPHGDDWNFNEHIWDRRNEPDHALYALTFYNHIMGFIFLDTMKLTGTDLVVPYIRVYAIDPKV